MAWHASAWRYVIRLLVASLLAGTPATASAWGDEGHEVVATIAFAQLTPKAKKQVEALLENDPTPDGCGKGSFVVDAV